MGDQQNMLLTCGSFGMCKLCSTKHLKKDLKKTISNKMLNEYLTHLKKRLKVTLFEKIQFIKDIIQTTNKNYINIKIC
jgi:hypothetical protein